MMRAWLSYLHIAEACHGSRHNMIQRSLILYSGIDSSSAIATTNRMAVLYSRRPYSAARKHMCRNDALAIGSICVAHVGYMAQRNPPAIRPKKRLAGYVEDIVAINQVYLSHMQDTREVKKQSNRQGRKARQRPRYDTKFGPKNVL